jgi:hypothetical protein
MEFSGQLIASLLVTQWSCFRELHAYSLTCLQDSWPEVAVKGFEPVTFGSVF